MIFKRKNNAKLTSLVIAVICLLVAGVVFGETINDGCKSEFGMYMSITPNSDLAIDYCHDGVFGVLLKTKSGERRFVSKTTKFLNPSFSPDGSALTFIEIDWTKRSTTVHLFDVRSGKFQVLYSAPGAIAYPVITSSRKTLYFWQGKFRERGKTFAAGFVLQRLSLDTGKIDVLDGPYFLPGKLSADAEGGIHYSIEGRGSRGFVYHAKRLTIGRSAPISFDLPYLYGNVSYTTRGYFYTEQYQKRSDPYYAYCIVGPGVASRTICPGKAFAASIDGRRLVYVNDKDKLVWMDLN